MYIKAVNEDYSDKYKSVYFNRLNVPYTDPTGSGFHFVQDKPEIIWGHPGFENPFKFRYLEVIPDPNSLLQYPDGTCVSRTITILREIPLWEIRNKNALTKLIFRFQKKYQNISTFREWRYYCRKKLN
jgi:hypothetical protein